MTQNIRPGMSTFDHSVWDSVDPEMIEFGVDLSEKELTELGLEMSDLLGQENEIGLDVSEFLDDSVDDWLDDNSEW